MITKIRIKRFRSIDDLEIRCGRITTFVGHNDAGKSNIVRALNLFFNSETDIGKQFSFERDYNKYSREIRKKAHEIEIQLTFEIPNSFTKSRSIDTEVKWQKVWRIDGYQPDKEKFTYVKNKNVTINDKGSLKSLLTRHNLLYAPAIKDRHFFSDLLGKIYTQLSSEKYGDFSDSSAEFNNALKSSTNGLANGLKEALGEDFTVSLPNDLKPIFENLDIRNADIPFDRRGDGIKVRHVPEMFNFLSDLVDKTASGTKGTANHIWIFEEPENNLEILAALELVKRIFSILEQSNNRQIFITTHSPVFYSMPVSKKISKIERYFIYLDEEKKFTHERKVADNEIESDLEVLNRISLTLSKIRSDIDSVEIDLNKAQRAGQINFLKPTIFVEGSTDVTVFRKALEVFFSAYRSKVLIRDVKSNGVWSLMHVVKMWHHQSKSLSNKVRAVAIIDDDVFSDLAQSKKLEDEIDFFKRQVKCVVSIQKIPKSKITTSIYGKGFKAPVDLESLYSNDFWKLADNKNWLERVADGRLITQNIIPKDLHDEYINSVEKRSIFNHLSDDERLRVTHRFSSQSYNKSKVEAANEIGKGANLDLEATLKEFKPVLEKALKFLFPNDRIKANAPQ